MSDRITYITGIDPEGNTLLGGLFAMKDQEGFPLDVSIDLVKDMVGYKVDYLELLADAGRQKQWKLDTVLDELKLLIPDQYNSIYEKFAQYFMCIKYDNNIEEFQDVCEFIYQSKRKEGNVVDSTDKCDKLRHE